MKKERFDFVFSLGSGCACSRMLRERGLQYASFPLDWVGGISFAHGAGEGVRRSAAIVAADFADWLRAEDLERATKYDSSRFDAYYNRRNGLYFTHDVPPGGDVAACLPRILETYRRRIDRFIARASASKSILAVYVSDPRDPGEIGEDDVRTALASLRGRYPRAEVRLIVAGCKAGTPPERAEVFRGDGWELMRFDYRAVTEGERTWDVRTELFAPVLDRFEAVDYRTRAEKRANAKRERERAYEKFRATSPLDLWLTRLRYKLYCHLRRKLERKGVLAPEG